MNKPLKQLMVRWAAGAVLLASSTSLIASTTLSLEPSSPQVGIGSTFTVNLVVSGLGDHSAPSLSLFDVDLSYDSSLFSLGSVAFGTGLGDVGQGEAITEANTATLGSVNLNEFSLLELSSLEALQTSTLTLASLSFTAIQSGTGSFGLTVNLVGDGLGEALDVGVAAAPGVSAVPIPAAIWLFGTVLAGMGVFANRRDIPVL